VAQRGVEPRQQGAHLVHWDVRGGHCWAPGGGTK
jgi:hypothetical protein